MIRPLDIALHVLPLQTRFPFRYGIAALTRAPHLVVRLEAEIDGRRAVGQSADILPPKWFTKNPDTAFEDDLVDFHAVIDAARAHALQLGPCENVFDLWRRLYDAQAAWARDTPHPPLLWHFGASLVERAAIDAFCRATGEPFPHALRRNTLGIDLAAMHPELAGQAPADLLPDRPLDTVRVRHTVGLADPLTDDDIPPGERLDDGLPQSLEANIAAYGLTHFKIKLSGDLAVDTPRLLRLADLLERAVGDRCRHTLDGNEQFKDADAFRAYWEQLAAEPRLAAFLRRLLFVEQPLHRDKALVVAVGHAWQAWPTRPPTVIDESDATPQSLPAALALGYAGTSHKNCKGVCKGVANACLIAHRRRQGHPLTLSGEDLANVGPVALLQDLAVAASLGIDHVERNGHHYFRGLTPWPQSIQAATREHHPDLYHAPGSAPGASAPGTTLAITDGRLALASVNAAPFGCGPLLDVSLLPRATAGTLRDAIGAGAP